MKDKAKNLEEIAKNLEKLTGRNYHIEIRGMKTGDAIARLARISYDVCESIADQRMR